MMSSLVFAGSSQFVAAKLLQEAAPGLVIVLTIAVVNLRHMLYSALGGRIRARLAAEVENLLAYLLTTKPTPPPSFTTKKSASNRGPLVLFSARGSPYG